MAQVTCPQCGKQVDPSEGYCMYCGYTFDDGNIKSPFAAAGAASATVSGSDEEETSTGSPVIRFDASNMDSMPVSSFGKSKPELMFGIGMCRILAILCAAIVIGSTFLPYITFTVSSVTKGSTSRSLSLIEVHSTYLYLMIAACIVGIIFAIKGKPVVYLLCSIGAGILSIINYLVMDSAVDIALGMTSKYIKKAMESSGMIFTKTHGAGFVLMIIGAIGMVIVAVMFFVNHEAYDD